MTPPKFLTGRCSDGSLLWAAIDTSAHHLEPRLGERRFQAYLAPYGSEEAARAALAAAGAEQIAPETGKRGKRG